MLFVDDKSNLEHASKTWNVVCGIQDKFCAVFSNCSIKCTKSELEGVVVKRFSSQMTDVIFQSALRFSKAEFVSRGSLTNCFVDLSSAKIRQ